MLRDWVAFSSSSGHTFRSVWRALGAEAHETFQGLFLDRDCGAESLALEFLPPQKIFKFAQSFEQQFLEWTKNRSGVNSAPIVFLIGYFKMISANFLQQDFPAVNTHPSLLPAFPGLDKKVHAAAFQQTLISGFTVHLVNEELDAGPIIFQKSVDIAQAQTSDEVREKVRALEQTFLPQCLEKILKTSLCAEDRHLSTRDLQAKYKGISQCAD